MPDATFTGTAAGRGSENHGLQLLRQPAAQPVQRAGSGGGRNARATSALTRPISPGNSPSRITGLPLAHRSLRSAALERSHVFGAPTVPYLVAHRNTKSGAPCAEAVETASCLWNSEEKVIESANRAVFTATAAYHPGVSS